MNQKTLKKRVARSIHIASGWLVSHLGYCPTCLNEAGNYGAVCITCFSSFDVLGRRFVFKHFCSQSDAVEKDPQLFLCPSCGQGWVKDTEYYLHKNNMECPHCKATFPSLRNQTYYRVEGNCENCGAFYAGAVPSSKEWLKCGTCGESLPAPAEPIAEGNV